MFISVQEANLVFITITWNIDLSLAGGFVQFADIFLQRSLERCIHWSIDFRILFCLFNDSAVIAAHQVVEIISITTLKLPASSELSHVV